MTDLTRPNDPGDLSPVERHYHALRDLTTDDLRAELGRMLSVSADNLARLAAIVRTLEERGDDLADLKLGLVDLLRRIAYGQVLPELVARYGVGSLLVKRAASLPLPDQRRIAAGEPVRVLVIEGGKIDHRTVPPEKLTRSELMQVIGDGHLRDDGEQRGYLIDQDRKPGRKRKAVAVDDGPAVRVDRRKRAIEVNGVTLTRAELLDYLRQLEG